MSETKRELNAKEWEECVLKAVEREDACIDEIATHYVSITISGVDVDFSMLHNAVLKRWGRIGLMHIQRITDRILYGV